jgi:anaerobic selenocysteine-containing dehydrogenase
MYNYLKEKYYVSGWISQATNEDEFEANVQKYLATSGSAAGRTTQWSNITSATYNPTAYGTGKGAGNGIVQVTYSSTDFVGERGLFWRSAAGDTTMTKSFTTKSGKIEFYNAAGALSLALNAHKNTQSTTYAGIMTAVNYPDTATGIGINGDKYALMPHWEAPGIPGTGDYKYSLIDYKSRLNREGRSQNAPWYYEFKSCDPGDEKWKDVVKINPADASAIGVVTGDTVKITSPSNTTGITCKVKVWNGVRQGTVAKSFGQGHWATGKYAAKTFGSVPNGGNNNQVIPAEYERLSGATARNACTKVKIEKVV